MGNNRKTGWHKILEFFNVYLVTNMGKGLLSPCGDETS